MSKRWLYLVLSIICDLIYLRSCVLSKTDKKFGFLNLEYQWINLITQLWIVIGLRKQDCTIPAVRIQTSTALSSQSTFLTRLYVCINYLSLIFPLSLSLFFSPSIAYPMFPPCFLPVEMVKRRKNVFQKCNRCWTVLDRTVMRVV